MIYANEIDPVACAVLRHCELADHVDERSIKDVRAGDVGSFRRAHFFAGAGLWEVAARLAGWPDNRELWTGSCPCQPLSVAGQRKGHVDERHLWPDFYRLIAERRPSTIVGEQVASKDGREWLAGVRADLESLGYACGAADLPACSVGAPHKRNRLWWVAVADAGLYREPYCRPTEDIREGIRANAGARDSFGPSGPVDDAGRDKSKRDGRAAIKGSNGTNDGILSQADGWGGPMADPECEQANEKQQRSEADEGGRCSDGSGGRAIWIASWVRRRLDQTRCRRKSAWRTKPGLRLLVARGWQPEELDLLALPCEAIQSYRKSPRKSSVRSSTEKGKPIDLTERGRLPLPRYLSIYQAL